jgi:hypothetical protein
MADNVPVPFQTKDKKGNPSSWFAIIKGKGLTKIGESDLTVEQAQAKLLDMIASMTPIGTAKKPNEEKSPLGTASTTSTTEKTEKPRPGDLRKNGLAELSPQKLQLMRERVALAIAQGNVSIDRALVTIFRDKVPIIDPASYGLLAMGWELACEQYFVNGIIPPWVLILLGNIQVVTTMYELSEPKKEEGQNGRANGTDSAAKDK